MYTIADYLLVRIIVGYLSSPLNAGLHGHPSLGICPTLCILVGFAHLALQSIKALLSSWY